jgi:tetratricopeptide (TPR) repeat protein
MALAGPLLGAWAADARQAEPGPAAGKPVPPAAARGVRASPPARTALERAKAARELEDLGAYARAVQGLKALRAAVPPDADLELALALDEARAGAADSARARLAAPLLERAAADSLPPSRRREYSYRREATWVNGRFDGWHWYVWRARAELLAAAGRWTEARDAARRATEARPLSGKDWLILAVAAGRAGDEEEARRAAREAMGLDPTLPEARYLNGLWEWRAGRKGEAQARFREAVALDSAYRPAALALIRARLPGAAPDTLPVELLTGARRVGLLTAPERPKPEELVEVDVSALLETPPDTAVVDSPVPGVKPLQLVLSVLVDERGRAVLNELPWFPPERIARDKVARLLASVPGWRFTPAVRLGAPHPVWISLDFYFNPE